MKKKKIDDDMSNTFVFEVGQKSAIFDDDFTDDINKKDDDFFDNSKKKKKTKQKSNKKKNNGFIMTLLMILCICIGIGLSYCYYEVYGSNFSKEKKCTTLENEGEEKLQPNGVFSESLIERYDAYNLNDSDIYKALYSKDLLKSKDISLDYVKEVVIKRALYLNSDYSKIAFSKDDFDRALKELFGDNISVSSDYIEGFKYNSKSKKYIYEKANAKANDDYRQIRKIVKSTKNKDSIEINVAVAIITGNKVLKSLDSDSVIDGVNSSNFDIDKEYTKLNQYKYIFSYDKENDNYILDSIVLIK